MRFLSSCNLNYPTHRNWGEIPSNLTTKQPQLAAGYDIRIRWNTFVKNLNFTQISYCINFQRSKFQTFRRSISTSFVIVFIWELCIYKLDFFSFLKIQKLNVSMSESSDILVPLTELSNILLELRSKLSDTLDLIIVSLILFVLVNILLYYLIHKVTDDDHDHKFRLFRRTKLPENTARALIVTAHPGKLIDNYKEKLKSNSIIKDQYNFSFSDDECMFFGPTLISLGKRKNCTTFLLCLTNGKYFNYDWTYLNLTTTINSLAMSQQATSTTKAKWENRNCGIPAMFSVLKLRILRFAIAHCSPIIPKRNGRPNFCLT